MTRVIPLTVVAVLATFADPMSVRAEDTYSIKLKENATGDVVAVDDSDTLTFGFKFEDAAGEPLHASTDKSGRTLVFRETVLAREAGKPASRLSRAYDKAELRRGDKVVTLPLQGETVLIEKKDGRFHFQASGRELVGSDAAGLNKEFNQDPDEERRDVTKLALPNKPVALNDSWVIDMAPVVRQLKNTSSFDADPDKAKGTGILRKVYMKDNHLYGVLHFDMEIPVKSFGGGARKFVLDEGVKVHTAADSDLCIDGSVEDETFKMDMKMDGSVSAPSADDSKERYKISFHGEGTRVRKELPK